MPYSLWKHINYNEQIVNSSQPNKHTTFPRKIGKLNTFACTYLSQEFELILNSQCSINYPNILSKLRSNQHSSPRKRAVKLEISSLVLVNFGRSILNVYLVRIRVPLVYLASYIQLGSLMV